jgi:ribosomal protein L11
MSLKRSSSAQRASFRSLRKKFIAGASASVLALGALVGFAAPASAATLTTTVPADGATGVAVSTTETTLTFDAEVLSGTGSILIKVGADIVDTINVGSPDVQPSEPGVGSLTKTIYSNFSLANTLYSIEIPSGVFKTALDETPVSEITLSFTTGAGDEAPGIGSVTITGTPTVGEILTAEADGVTGTPDPTLSYQWEADSVDIADATSSTFTLTSAQIGKVIRVKVTAENSVDIYLVRSDPTAAVADAEVVGVAPEIATATITGTPTVGQALTAGSTGVTGTPTPTLSYQWKADGINIVDATSSTFTLTSAQLGAVITVVVTATNATSPAASATSTGTTAVADAEVVGVAPEIATATITGTPTVGQVLTAGSTGVTGTPTPTLSYQWKADGINIVDATSSTFTLTSAQLGAVITVEVTVTNTQGSDSALSSGTTAVAAAPVVSSPAPSAGGGTVVAPPVQAPAPTPVAAPQTTRTQAFAANSAKLSKDLRVSIREALASNPNAKSAVCRGFVASGTATAADRKLARDRSTAVCNLITKLNPDLDVEVKKVVVASSSKQLRKVRMVLR